MPRVIPYDPDAESALVGSLLLSRYWADEVRDLVLPEDFHDPEMGRIYASYMSLIDEGQHTDVVTVASRSGLERERLVEIQVDTPASANTLSYARIVVEMASRRRFIGASSAIADAAGNLDIRYPDVLGIAEESVRRAQLPVGTATPAPNLDEFVDMPSMDADWIVEGLVARQDRILVVAGEGHGKSLLMTQVLGCAAAGVHPFTMFAIPPVKVMLIDLENPRQLLARRMRRLRDSLVTLTSSWDPTRFAVASRPEGLDVTDRADELWLIDQVGRHRPDLLAIGPAYKLHESSEENSSDVRQVLKVLDRIRTRYRCALMIETHAPHEVFRRGPNGERAKMRPAGSRLWIRWPEMVLGLEPQAENRLDGRWLLGNVRPPREPREWPHHLLRGGPTSPLRWVVAETDERYYERY